MKLETLRVKLLGGEQRAAAVLLSSERGEGDADAAIRDFPPRDRASRPVGRTGWRGADLRTASHAARIDVNTVTPRESRGPISRTGLAHDSGCPARLPHEMGPRFRGDDERGAIDPMCGIAGLYYPGTPKPVDPARIAAMADAMVHRGPDGSGVWTAPGVGLGHRRLSIIDLGGGAQPMATTDHGVIVSYNGEIYNFRAVRAELEALGARFRPNRTPKSCSTAGAPWGPNPARAARRHVRFRALRCPAPQPVPRARPLRSEAAPLCRAVRRRGRLRLGAQGPARAPAAAPPARFPRRSRIFSGSAMCRTTPCIVAGGTQAGGGAFPAARARQAHARAGALVGPRLFEARQGQVRRSRRRAARADARRGAFADDRRCAARRLPLGRCRQLGGGPR